MAKLFQSSNTSNRTPASRGIRKVPAGHELLTCSRSASGSILRFRGAQCFRERLIYSTLSSRPIRISDIRSLSESPGLQEHEVSLLRLLERITNGSKIEISATGTNVLYRPGFIVGGNVIEPHQCHTSRSIGYYLEALISLVPFAKKKTHIVLQGITNDENDVSVDIFRTVILPSLKPFGIDDEVELKVQKRGAPPLGGGEILFSCPAVTQLKTVLLTDCGKVKRVRGVAYTARVNPSLANRVVDASRAFFNNFLPDVWIYTDHFKGENAGRSPGYALAVVSESTTECLLSAEMIGGKDSTPELVGEIASKKLLHEISSGGCVDSSSQSLFLLFMALCPADVSRVRFGKLSPLAVKSLRHIRDFFGVSFRLKPDVKDHTVVASCRGMGYKNIARKSLA